jgi:hypothetical protein
MPKNLSGLPLTITQKKLLELSTAAVWMFKDDSGAFVGPSPHLFIQQQLLPLSL